MTPLSSEVYRCRWFVIVASYPMPPWFKWYGMRWLMFKLGNWEFYRTKALPNTKPW